MDINNIVSTTTQTIEKLKEYKNWWNALFLYFDYIKHSRIQKTNQVWCNDEFMMKSTWYWVDKFRWAKNVLKEIWLIEVIQERWEDWKLWKFYIKINFLIWEEKREKNIKPESGEIHTQEKPGIGETTLNALNNKIKILEKENKMLKENFNKLKEQSSELVKVDKRVLEIDLIIDTLKECNMWIIDDTIKKQRQYGKLIKDKMLQIKGFNWDYVWFIKYAYENSDEYRKNHFRSAEQFYYNIANIIAWLKIQAEKPKVRRWC